MPAASAPAPTPTPSPVVASAPLPATSLHAQPAAPLDLRQVEPTPIPTPTTQSTLPEPTPEPAPTPVVVEPAIKTEVTSTRRRAERAANAQTTTKSQLVTKFQTPAEDSPEPAVETPTTPAAQPPPAQPASPPAPTAQPLSQAPAYAPSVPIAADDEGPAANPTPPIQPKSPYPTPVPVQSTQPQPTPTPSPPSPPAAPIQPAAPAPTSAVMPGAVATAVDANKRLVAPAKLASVSPEAARKQAFDLALANAPKRNNTATVAAALASVAIIGGYIWLQNAPKLAIHTAAGRAGFAAALPSYLPNNYNLQKPVQASPGRIVLSYGSTDRNNLVINEQRTDWDSQSLLDNYVTQQSKDYLTINQQGLTIYLYNSTMASWVNRGIWYSIQGNEHLNREQLLKIAYGL